MKPDDLVCLCFRVTLRKVQQFLAARKPAKASQLSECYGAGTGCGWCRRYLQQLHAQSMAPQDTPHSDKPPAELPDAETYAAGRAVYRTQRR